MKPNRFDKKSTKFEKYMEVVSRAKPPETSIGGVLKESADATDATLETPIPAANSRKKRAGGRRKHLLNSKAFKENISWILTLASILLIGFGMGAAWANLNDSLQNLSTEVSDIRVRNEKFTESSRDHFQKIEERLSVLLERVNSFFNGPT